MSTRQPRKDELVISDARAIKALAHPARLTVVDELYSGRVLTSSELAELAGLTPSAMSYHLRALERWGMVERAEPRVDGRERPWRATGSAVNVHTERTPDGRRASPSASAAVAAVALGYLDRLRDGLTRWISVSATDPWHDVGRMRSGFHDLTREEAAHLTSELDAILDRYRADRETGRRRPGTRRTAVFFAIYPTDPPDES